MDSEVLASDEDSMNANYQGKISITSSYFQDNRGTMMRINSTYAFWQEEYAGNIARVIIEPNLEPKETELTWDVSEAKDGSVMSYLVQNENDNTKYDLYIQSNGGVIAPVDSIKLFSLYTEIYLGNGCWDGYTALEEIIGLEYLDTSKVTNMSYLFWNCSSLTSLDLSNFDISSVTYMPNMFYEMPTTAIIYAKDETT